MNQVRPFLSRRRRFPEPAIARAARSGLVVWAAATGLCCCAILGGGLPTNHATTLAGEASNFGPVVRRATRPAIATRAVQVPASSPLAKEAVAHLPVVKRATKPDSKLLEPVKAVPPAATSEKVERTVAEAGGFAIASDLGTDHRQVGYQAADHRPVVRRAGRPPALPETTAFAGPPPLAGSALFQRPAVLQNTLLQNTLLQNIVPPISVNPEIVPALAQSKTLQEPLAERAATSPTVEEPLLASVASVDAPSKGIVTPPAARTLRKVHIFSAPYISKAPAIAQPAPASDLAANRSRQQPNRNEQLASLKAITPPRLKLEGQPTASKADAHETPTATHSPVVQRTLRPKAVVVRAASKQKPIGEPLIGTTRGSTRVVSVLPPPPATGSLSGAAKAQAIAVKPQPARSVGLSSERVQKISTVLGGEQPALPPTAAKSLAKLPLTKDRAISVSQTGDAPRAKPKKSKQLVARADLRTDDAERHAPVVTRAKRPKTIAKRVLPVASRVAALELFEEPELPVEEIAVGEEASGQEQLASIENVDEDFTPLSELKLELTPGEGELPTNVAAQRFRKAGAVRSREGSSREWLGYTYNWQASAFCHNPLYFEDVNLERHGHTLGCLQSAVSFAHFFGAVPLLPYHMTAEPPHECIYTLGHHRPGTYVPPHCNLPPLDPAAITAQAGVTAGLILLIP